MRCFEIYTGNAKPKQIEWQNTIISFILQENFEQEVSGRF